MKIILPRTFYGYTIILLLFLCLINGYGQKQSTANDPYKQALSRYISGMTGVGCDTMLAKQLLRALREPVTTKNKITIPEGTKSRVAVPAELQDGFLAAATTTVNTTNGWNHAGNYLNIPDTYQWYVSPDGNDNNPGTKQAPFRDIQRATDMASNGDAIKIADGNYNCFNITGKNIYLVGNLACPHSVIIDASDNTGAYLSNCSPELHGMKFINGCNAIYIDNAFPFLSHLVMTQNFCPTIYAGGQNYIYTLCNSLLYENNAGSEPVIVHHPTVSGFTDICNVTIADNQGGSALSVKWGTGHSDIYVMNTIMYNPEISAEMSVSYIGGSSATVTYSNIYRKNDLPHSMIYFGDGVIDLDPLFDLQDFIRRYQLADNSPCIDAGFPDFYDYSFPPGKGGSCSDMGAYGYESRMTGSCQAPSEGDDFESAIDIGSFHDSFQYSDTRVPADYKNDFPWVEGVDVFYRFTIDRTMDILLNHCASSVYDTYVALLNNEGAIMYSNDDSSGEDGCPSPKHARLLVENLPAGTYWVLSKMTQDDDGELTTTVQGSAWGNDMDRPINAGEYNRAFQYANTQNTGHFTNTYTGRSTNDIFYKFSISQRMDITVSHCGSGLDNTYMHLLDANGDVIMYNDDYAGEGMCPSPLHACIKRTLNAGTYYVVSEGQSQEGSIRTYIQGSLPAYSDDLGYPGNPPVTGNNTTDNSAVGITPGTFDVSATGAATYSIPIAIPPGVNGLQPSLAIVYNSQAGNGVAGWGCSLLGTSAITRVPKSEYYDQTTKGLTYLADDGYALDGQRLVLSSGTAGQDGAIYHTEADPFTKITVHGSAANTWFEVVTKDGMKYYYGGVSNSDGRHVYYDTSNPSNTVTKVNAWYLDYVEDPSGNYMNYYYSRYEHFTYLASVIYGKNKHVSSSFYNMVSMSYQGRTDQAPFIFDGIPGKMLQRLEKVTCRTGNDTFREYTLEYANTDHFSRLVSVTEKNGQGEALKPVTLDWGYYGTSNSHTASPLTLEGSLTDLDKQYYTTADLNGDGISDIIGITVNYQYEEYNRTYIKTLSQHFIATRQDNGTYKYVATAPKYLPENMKISKIKHRQGLEGQLSFNALGDGRQYLLAPYRTNEHVLFYLYGLDSPVNITSPHPDYLADLQRSNEMPAYTTGDIDGKGKDAIVYLEKGHENGVYPGRIGRVILFNDYNSPKYAWEEISLPLPSTPERLFLADFNGDGMNDLLVFYSGGHTLYFNQGGQTPFSDSRKATSSYTANKYSILQLGDFNGDGLPDLILNNTDDPDWYFMLNQGNGTFSPQLAATLPGMHDHDFTTKDNLRFNCLVIDLDFDSRSDVVVTKGIYDREGSWGNFREVKTYWLRSTGAALNDFNTATSSFEDNADNQLFIAGDFNGDGRPEIANYGYNCFNGSSSRQWRTYQRNGLQLHSGLLTSVTDGMGNQTSIEYGSFTDDRLYTKGTDGAFPVMDIQPALTAVKTVTTPDGIGGTGQTSYTYGGLKVHLQGKGLLGISRTMATDHLTGVTVESGVSAWNNTWYVPAATYQKTSA
ncbi:MAG: FG-GAP-like repeat-containing protein, partial [Bacteroidales bacterium]|nr:FG-GAP-like repeat-containing protein [Bacteroidales bacterium]